MKRKPLLSLFLLCLFTIALFACAFADSNEKSIKEAVVNFFYCCEQKKYAKAYDYFSDSVKSEISYMKFGMKARDIKKASIKSLKIYDSDKYLAKMEIRVKLEMYYREKYYLALYRGTCDLVKENNKWKLAAVDLTAEEATPVKNLDFTK